MKKGLKITLITLASIIGLLLVLLICISLFGGTIARNYVNSHGEELVGRKTQINDISLNLFSGHVAIEGLAIYEEDQQTVFAGFDSLDISLKLIKLIASEVYVQHITLAGLNVNVEQNGEVFNFTSIINHFQSDTTQEEETDTTPSAWVVNLHNIRLNHGQIAYTDLQLNSHWGLDDINLLIPDFSIGGASATNGGLTLQLADGGSLKADFDYDAKSNDFDVVIALDQFALNQAKAYMTNFVNVSEIGGRMNLHATIAGNLSTIMQMNVDGDLSLNDIDVVDGSGTSVATCKQIAVKLDGINLEDNKYDIASVLIDQLNTKFETYTDHHSFTNLLSVAAPTPMADTTTTQPDTINAQPDTTAAKPMQLTIAHFEVKDCAVTYADHTMPDDFVFPVSHINIQSNNITLTGENSANLFAALPGGGHAMIQWQGNISDWKKHQDLKLRIKDLHLTTLSPYLVAYLGQPIEDGIFSFVSDNRIDNSQLQGKNHLDIYKIEVGSRRKDVDPQMKLPLKAALYILKDKDDKVIMDLPISGDIDNPEFNYMKLVWKTLGQLLVKVATSPVRALGDLFHGQSADDDRLFIAIDTAQCDFTSEQYYQIDRVGEMAKLDESITLVVDHQVFSTNDTAALPLVSTRQNEIMRRHLQHLGIKENQIKITATQVTDIKKNGYSIRTEVAGMENTEPIAQP
ncbi:MAG: DUF748 domain-containing protein [Bacteroidales bacterium]|nr:DUF748 domain-containing protein [Candidatus Colimorpha onthohippi]